MTRLLIAAPSAVVRAGLETLVASDPDLEIAGSFPDLSSLETLRPDVVLAALPPAHPIAHGSPAEPPSEHASHEANHFA